MMERVRQLCLSLPHVTEHVQWTDHLVFKIGGKMFAVTTFEPRGPGNAMSWKTSPQEFPNLIERPGVIPAPYLARAKWVALERWEDMTWPDIAEQIQAAYEIVKASLPKRMQANLGSTNTGQTRASARVSKAVASTARSSGGKSPRAKATSAKAKSNSKAAPNKSTKKRSIQKSTRKTVRP
jgi:predicted DNA-binding protein (MmcQ/YjbR family)